MTDDTAGSLLRSYPRSRQPLTKEHKEIFVAEYKLNRCGGTWLYRLTQYLESWMHRAVAARGRGIQGSILEIGAGALNHIPYEQSCCIYNCVEPFKELYEDSAYSHRVRRLYDDMSDIPDEAQYDRILSVAVLEH